MPYDDYTYDNETPTRDGDPNKEYGYARDLSDIRMMMDVEDIRIPDYTINAINDVDSDKVDVIDGQLHVLYGRHAGIKAAKDLYDEEEMKKVSDKFKD